MSLVNVPMMSPKRYFLVSALALAAATVACNKKEEAATDAPKPVMTVDLVSPQQRDWPRKLSAYGNVAAWQEAVVGAEVGGARLLDVKVNVGDYVKKGQELARFDTAMLEAIQAQSEADVARAEANLAKALADADRAVQLDQTGSISQQDIHQYRTAAATAEAQLRLSRAQRDVSALQLRYARVLAPDDGLISARAATVGTVVPAGSELFRLIRGPRLEWRAEVPGDELEHLAPGMPATIRLPGGGIVSGQLRQIAPTVDVGTRNALIYVDLPKTSKLSVGQFVGGEFELGHRSALTLPESALVLRDGHSYVMRVDAEHIVHQIKVETGRREGGEIEVAGALDAQAQIVKAGGSFIGEGDLIAVSAAPPAAGSSAATAAGSANSAAEAP